MMGTTKMIRFVTISIACEIEENNEADDTVWAKPLTPTRYLVSGTKVAWEKGDRRY